MKIETIFGLLSDIATVLTAIVLMFWYFYTVHKNKKQSYFAEIPGVYYYEEEVDSGTAVHGFDLTITNVDTEGKISGKYRVCFLKETTPDTYEITLFDFNTVNGKIRYHYQPKSTNVYKKGRLYHGIIDVALNFSGQGIDNLMVRYGYHLIHNRDLNRMTLIRKDCPLGPIGDNRQRHDFTYGTTKPKIEMFKRRKNDLLMSRRSPKSVFDIAEEINPDYKVS